MNNAPRPIIIVANTVLGYLQANTKRVATNAIFNTPSKIQINCNWQNQSASWFNISGIGELLSPYSYIIPQLEETCTNILVLIP